MLIAVLIGAFFCAGTGTAQTSGAQALLLHGDVAGTHDPSAAKDGDTYYVFSTGKSAEGGQFAIRCSQNLKEWKECGQVFSVIPEWIQKDEPGIKDLWAPDISFYKGTYRLYYAYSAFGKNTSGIALATNKSLNPSNPEYKWVDQGLVLRSVAADNFNAIDPSWIVDDHGGQWLAFGSFWSGIKMRRIDASTGKLSAKDTRTYSLAARRMPPDAVPAPPGRPAEWEAVEAPFVLHHGSYFYLFVSWDLCCRGASSTYRTMVGRSKRASGPYVAEDGTLMMNGGATQLLAGNAVWRGPGGASVLHEGSRDYLVFHAYDGRSGRPYLQISTIGWEREWPVVALEGN